MTFSLKRDKCACILETAGRGRRFFLLIRTGDTKRFGFGIEWGEFFFVSGTETRGFCSVYLEILVSTAFAKRRISLFLSDEKNPDIELKRIWRMGKQPHYRASLPLIGLWSCYSIGNGHHSDPTQIRRWARSSMNCSDHDAAPLARGDGLTHGTSDNCASEKSPAEVQKNGGPFLIKSEPFSVCVIP